MSTYFDHINEITADEIYEGLLGYGLFADKFPNAFTSEEFYKYVNQKKPGFPKKDDFDFVRYENTRNINVPRLLAIPHPIGFANLIEEIKDDWTNIQSHFKDNTKNQKHKVSKIHLRKIKDSKVLFKMNYKTEEDESFDNVDLLIEKKYRVNADISNCFPSIYSHSLPWALIGKIESKKKKDPSLWFNKIDKYLRNIKNQETNGVLIGPHVSNLISEIILVAIDSKLVSKGYQFIRHIDDYTCYTKTKEEAERFLIDLSHELKEYELNLNHKKSLIEQLPFAETSHWVRKLKNHRFNSYKANDDTWFLSAREVEVFLDIAIDLMHSENDNSSILNYALKKLSKKNLDLKAVQYLIKRVHHLTYIYPYLVQILEESIIEPFKIEKEKIKEIADSLFALGIEKEIYEACSYAVYFSLKYDFKLSNGQIRKSALESKDCILMILSFLYSKKHGKCLFHFYLRAVRLKKSDPDRYWLFIYETLPKRFFEDSLKAMKNNGVSFIRPEYR